MNCRKYSPRAQFVTELPRSPAGLPGVAHRISRRVFLCRKIFPTKAGQIYRPRKFFQDLFGPPGRRMTGDPSCGRSAAWRRRAECGRAALLARGLRYWREVCATGTNVY